MSETTKCYLCDSEVIVNEHCQKCGKAYCALDASKWDPAIYCDECMQDIAIEETTFTRSSTEFNENTNITYTNTQSCKQILFKGLDWLFACQEIAKLPDEELMPFLDYHKAFVLQLEAEIVSRKVQRAHQRVQLDHPAAKKILSVVKTVTTKTTKQAKAVPQALSMEMIADLAIKLGMNSASEVWEYLKKSGKVKVQ